MEPINQSSIINDKPKGEIQPSFRRYDPPSTGFQWSTPSLKPTGNTGKTLSIDSPQLCSLTSNSTIVFLQTCSASKPMGDGRFKYRKREELGSIELREEALLSRRVLWEVENYFPFLYISS